MLVTFLKDCRISEDGFTVIACKKGEVTDIADTAARTAIHLRLAKMTGGNNGKRF